MIVHIEYKAFPMNVRCRRGSFVIHEKQLSFFVFNFLLLRSKILKHLAIAGAQLIT